MQKSVAHQACPEPPLPDSLVHRLHVCLSEPVCYDEMAVSFSRLQQDCRDYLALLRHYNLPVDDSLQTQHTAHDPYTCTHRAGRSPAG
ncbi:hypothetical protein FJT64_004441 [Amphibalanus amphitrite]|uniref:Mot1 central domain-containing protein n=1 Tax=Amphibalanus amphitrite TaxID=1232801 RepID=A0A6A4W8F7_AMPAM|nr:hypothetical protein FJT64_004441 [Amphibalanus amphitrite]